MTSIFQFGNQRTPPTGYSVTTWIALFSLGRPFSNYDALLSREEESEVDRIRVCTLHIISSLYCLLEYQQV
jgi:hypothetical protein